MLEVTMLFSEDTRLHEHDGYLKRLALRLREHDGYLKRLALRLREHNGFVKAIITMIKALIANCNLSR